MAELGLTADSVAFVDDDPMERAEVSFSLPDVLVLAPDDMTAAAGWPQFSPAVVTDEARRRGELYRQRRGPAGGGRGVRGGTAGVPLDSPAQGRIQAGPPRAPPRADRADRTRRP